MYNELQHIPPWTERQQLNNGKDEMKSKNADEVKASEFSFVFFTPFLSFTLRFVHILVYDFNLYFSSRMQMMCGFLKQTWQITDKFHQFSCVDFLFVYVFVRCKIILGLNLKLAPEMIQQKQL